MFNIKNPLPLTLACLFSLGLSACGGSNNHDMSQQTPPQIPQQTPQELARIAHLNSAKIFLDHNQNYKQGEKVIVNGKTLSEGLTDGYASLDFRHIVQSGFNDQPYTKTLNKQKKSEGHLRSYQGLHSFAANLYHNLGSEGFYSGIPVKHMPEHGTALYVGTVFDRSTQNGEFSYTIDFDKKIGKGELQSGQHGKFSLNEAKLQGNKLEGGATGTGENWVYNAGLYGENAEELSGVLKQINKTGETINGYQFDQNHIGFMGGKALK